MSEFETIPEIAAGYASRKISPRDIVQRCLARIEKLDTDLNAFLDVADEHAMAAAAEAEESILRFGQQGPLQGVPFALKDVFDRKGFRTSAHSRLLSNNIALRSAACVRHLEAAGGIYIGKLATHEFAIGGPAFDLPAPPARNPWCKDLFTGGSSSGSGAAVAARMVPFALGTDTGGSVRNPAASCGIVGIKPTHGAIDLDGVVELSRSLDCVGPLTSDVLGNEIVFGVLAGRAFETPPVEAVPAGLSGTRIGVIRRYYRKDMIASPEMDSAIETALQVLADQGAVVSEVDAPGLSEMADCNRVILITEAYSVHRKSLRDRYHQYSASTRARILPGAFVTAADYADACRLRGRFIERIDSALSGFDVLITATNMEPPARLDDEETLNARYSRHARAPFSLTGHPALSVPIGLTTSGLPLAMQIVGRHHDERSVYRVAQGYAQAVPETNAAPPISLAGM